MKQKKTTNKVDAVIVLANLMNEKGILNHESLSRAKLAVDVFLNTNATYLVTCGWAYRGDSDDSIAAAFKEYIISTHEVDSASILLEENSRDTVGDAFFTKINLATPLDLKKIIVVTSGYHIDRVKEIFNFIYGEDFLIEFIGAPIKVCDSVKKNEERALNAFRETFTGVLSGDDADIFHALINKHPYYDGRIFPKIENRY
jgi:uncharacterized SAM-binding protein YcdF (DUF218 family)